MECMDTDYWIRQQNQGKVIVLIHGIGAKDPRIYWQKFLSVLMDDEKFHDFDLFIWQYPTHVKLGSIQNLLEMVQRKTLRETAPSIEILGSAWNTTYDTEFQTYHEVILVCHSMGGLVVKSWILDALEKGESAKLFALCHIAFYATPQQGAPITRQAHWNQQLKDMQIHGSFIENVDRRWYDHVVAWKGHHVGPADERFNRYIPHLVLAGLQDKVVPPGYATIRGMHLAQIQGDHSGVISPRNRNDIRYKAWSIDLDKTYAIAPHENNLLSPASQIPSQEQPAVQRPEQVPSTTTSSLGESASQVVSANSSPSAAENSHAIRVFLVYAEKDKHWLSQLETHLSMLQRNGLISLWQKQQLIAGTDCAGEVDQQIEQASLILLLVSADFLASDYIHHVEMKRAMERQAAGEVRVIPILLRPADWENTVFGHLQPLPSDKKPLSNWHNRDQAFLHVVEGIKQVIKTMQKANEPIEKPLPPREPITLPHPTERKRGSFPLVWNVPYRYPAFFTGRDQVVERLFALFTPQPLSGGSIAPWALTGLGGLGKTQTAVAYAYLHRDNYQSVFWANAETEGDLVTSFTTMAKQLVLPGVDLQHRESVLNGMNAWFANTTDWLLIVDNADDLVMVTQFLPQHASGHVLLTSRVAATGREAQSLELSPLSPDDGALCLLRRANYIPWTGQLGDAPSPASVKAAQELSERMGGLPLALEQAGAYIETTGRGVGGYLELYKEYRPDIQKKYYGDVRSYREAVAFTWSIARKSVEFASPVATELLFLCAFLAPDAISYQMFPKDVRILGPKLGPVAADPLQLDQVMTLLRKHSLIQNRADRGTDIAQIFIHRVLQEVIRDGMDTKAQRLWAERAVRMVALALDKVDWSIMQAHVQQCLPLIDQWQMNLREADVIRQWYAAEHT